MFKLRVKSKFDAAHKLANYEGKCSQLHGHTYNVEITILHANYSMKDGICMDFGKISEDLEKVISKLDHSYLTPIETEAMNTKGVINLFPNPTAEVIAEYIFLELDKIGYKSLSQVTVWETDKYGVTYKK